MESVPNEISTCMLSARVRTLLLDKGALLSIDIEYRKTEKNNIK